MDTAFPAPVQVTVAGVVALDDDELIGLQSSLAAERRRIDAACAIVAAEVARRSGPDRGYEGIAVRRGERTPIALVQRVTGTTAREAGALLRVGALIASGTAIGEAVAAGGLSVAAADAIHAGLGSAGDVLPAPVIEAASLGLIEAATDLTVEQLAARARDARAALDEPSIAAREEQLRSRRYLRLRREEDGMTRIHGLLDPESAAIIGSAIDAATSPRRGGPRWVSTEDEVRAARLERDSRTTDQIALDTLVELVRLGGAVAPRELLGMRRPAVRIHVTDLDLARRAGAARIEGQTEPISLGTAERHVCEAGMVPILFDSEGQVVNVGRDQRLFTARQRIGLAARDGGCRWPGCDRPPAWCEAHHIDEWHRDRGSTDVADGVLLCRHHHLLVHNNGWRIVRDGARYSAIPPAAVEPARTPVPMKSRLRC